jgi:hypothetical protein
VHLWVCWHCRRLVRQILWLGQMARQYASRKRDTGGDLEARIIRNLSGQV